MRFHLLYAASFLQLFGLGAATSETNNTDDLPLLQTSASTEIYVHVSSSKVPATDAEDMNCTGYEGSADGAAISKESDDEDDKTDEEPYDDNQASGDDESDNVPSSKDDSKRIIIIATCVLAVVLLILIVLMLLKWCIHIDQCGTYRLANGEAT